MPDLQLISSSEASPVPSRRAVASLSISIVVYHPDLPLLRETCRSLGVALRQAHEGGVLSRADVDIVDNGDEDPAVLRAALAEVGEAAWLRHRIHSGGGNVGYARGHNGPLMASDADYHLVLNPDVRLEGGALLAAIRFLDATPDVGLIAPQVHGPDGERQYLCRAYPSVLVLFLRGFAPGPLRRLFRRYMHAHELRDRIGERVVRGVPLISGCFMLGRANLFRQVGGFAPDYFLYFEDSDLSLAMGRVAAVAYVPSVRIVHFGGGAARKGWAHTRMFVTSALTFFRRNGWRLV